MWTTSFRIERGSSGLEERELVLSVPLKIVELAFVDADTLVNVALDFLEVPACVKVFRKILSGTASILFNTSTWPVLLIRMMSPGLHILAVLAKSFGTGALGASCAGQD